MSGQNATRRFDSVLVANRGEIAARIQRSCRALGLRTVAVFSTADRGASYVESADDAVCIGPPPAGQSYLNVPALIVAARLTRAGAIHPGYGFLSESAGFAAAVEAAGLTFVGPPADAIRVMGDKVAAKRAMEEAGVPCVPGSAGALPDNPAAVASIAERVGYPLLIKAAGGGGGRGMRLVERAETLAADVAATREEAQRYFSNGDVYLEKFLIAPRHVEIQVFCDSHGNAVWLGDRDCSLQRRHQKLIEEAPAPGISRSVVAGIGTLCVEACKRIGYVGAGTFEFLYQDDRFYFIEMNTRLQVEHPVTEMTAGVDIVELQLRTALGEPLGIEQADIAQSGHAIECRINAEEPFSFLPRPGTLTSLKLPEAPGIRVDTHLRAGSIVPPHYDSLVAKLISHGQTRAEAIERMREALARTEFHGITTNVAFHAEFLSDDEFARGGVSIRHLEQWLATRS